MASSAVMAFIVGFFMILSVFITMSQADVEATTNINLRINQSEQFDDSPPDGSTFGTIRGFISTFFSMIFFTAGIDGLPIAVRAFISIIDIVFFYEIVQLLRGT